MQTLLFRRMGIYVGTDRTSLADLVLFLRTHPDIASFIRVLNLYGAPRRQPLQTLTLEDISLLFFSLVNLTQLSLTHFVWAEERTNTAEALEAPNSLNTLCLQSIVTHVQGDSPLKILHSARRWKRVCIYDIDHMGGAPTLSGAPFICSQLSIRHHPAADFTRVLPNTQQVFCEVEKFSAFGIDNSHVNIVRHVLTANVHTLQTVWISLNGSKPGR